MGNVNIKNNKPKNLIKKIIIILLFLTLFILFMLTLNNEIVTPRQSNYNKTITYEQSKELNNTNISDISIYFYKLGKKNSDGTFSNAKAEGESFIIIIGDVEILVDAGTDVGSAPAIIEQMRNHVSDDKIWDYIIVTHADKDHIGALGSPTLSQSVFKLFIDDKEKAEMTLGTLIDFDITKDDTNNYIRKEELFVSKLYQQYSTYRDLLIEQKGINYYPASQCIWKQRGLDKAPVKGLTNEFVLDKKGITLTILDNFYCYNKYNSNTKVGPLDRNNLCVCFTINSMNDKGSIDRFLFTGDLEEYDSTQDYKCVFGETKLVDRNPQLKEGVVFYKAGHHGSRTSSSRYFIENIKPQNVVFTGIAGNDSNALPNSKDSFPAYDVINNVFKYTDKIFIPTFANFDNENKTIEDYYGEINLNYNLDGKVRVVCTSNMDIDTGEPIPIQNTDWFKKYRQAKINVYNFSSYKDNSSRPFGNCTLVKYGHYDILIDCGVYAFNGGSYINSTIYLDKLRDLCVDGVLEYVIVSSPNTYSIQQMVSTKDKMGNVKKGALAEYKVENLIDFGNVPDPSKNFTKSLYSRYQKEKKELIEKGTKYFSVSELLDKNIEITDGLFIDILYNDFYETDENSDVSFTIDFRGNKLLFLGNNRKEALESIYNNAKKGFNNLNNIVFMQIPNNGQIESYSKGLYDFVFSNTKEISIVSTSILNDNFFDRIRFDKSFCDNLIYGKQHNNVYISSEMDENNKYSEICGDICFSIGYQKIENIDVFNYLVKCSTNKNILLEDTNYYNSL